MFAPPDRREALFALYAFNYEVARVREIVSDAMIGQIRLQWWREALDEIVLGKAPRAHEVVAPLAAAIRAHGLPLAAFERLIDARELDLADQPPPSLSGLHFYLDGASGALVELALAALGVAGEGAKAAAHAAGIGFGMAGLLRALPFHAGSRRLYLPADMMARHGIDSDEVFAGKGSPGLKLLAAELAAMAREHLDAAAQAVRQLPRAAVPALLPAAIARGWLADLARNGYDPFAPVPERRLRRLARVAWAARTGRL